MRGKAGAAPAYGDGGGCDSGTVTCDVTASEPYQFSPGTQTIYFEAVTHCSEAVPQIRMGQDVIHSTPIDPNNPLTNSTVVTNNSIATTYNRAVCQPGQYAVNASARITPPDWDIVIGSLQDTSATVTSPQVIAPAAAVACWSAAACPAASARTALARLAAVPGSRSHLAR